MILVVGATGTIGQHVVAGLCQAETPTRALVRDPRRGKALADHGAEFVLGDLAIPPTLEAALSGVDRVFLATPAEPRQVELHTNLINEAKHHGIGYIVRISGIGARADAGVELLRWHATGEAELAASEIPHLNLRCSAFMQNLLADVGMIELEGRLVGCMGDARVAYVDARDIAAAAVGALTATNPPTGTLDVTGPSAVTMDQIARAISSIRGTVIRYEDLPPHEIKSRFEKAGMPVWLADDLVALGGELAGGSNATVTTTVHDLAGRDPISIEMFLEEHAALIRGKDPE